MTLRLPTVPLTGNRLLRAHWSVQRREVRRWEEAILRYVGCYGPLRGTRVRRRAWIIVRVWRRRLQDEDNFQTSLKPVLDALRRCGWIYEDSRHWLVKDAVELPTKGTKPRTEIEVRWTGLGGQE
jgi:hypothetical protein